MNWIQNKTWFMIPINIAIILILIKGFREIFIGKQYPPLAILWFGLVIILCIDVNVYAYFKLKEITEQQIMEAVKDELV